MIEATFLMREVGSYMEMECLLTFIFKFLMSLNGNHVIPLIMLLPLCLDVCLLLQVHYILLVSLIHWTGTVLSKKIDEVHVLDSAPPHKLRKILATLRFCSFKDISYHPSYVPDLVPIQYVVFRLMKTFLWANRFIAMMN